MVREQKIPDEREDGMKVTLRGARRCDNRAFALQVSSFSPAGFTMTSHRGIYV